MDDVHVRVAGGFHLCEDGGSLLRRASLFGVRNRISFSCVFDWSWECHMTNVSSIAIAVNYVTMLLLKVLDSYLELQVPCMMHIRKMA